MAILFHAAWLLVAVAVHTSAGCDMEYLGACSKNCGGGHADSNITCSNDTCTAISLTCNLEPCPESTGSYEDWSKCSAPCRAGKKTRRTGNETDTIACNVHSCAPGKCTACDGEIIFLVDGSSSMTNLGFELAKQVVSDTVSGLPSCVLVSVLTYSTEVNVVVDKQKSPDVDAILNHRFSGGCGVMAYGIEKAKQIFSDTPAGVPKILATLSDGSQTSFEICTNEIAMAMRADGVTMLSVVAPGATPHMLYPVTSANYSDHQFLLETTDVADSLTAAIRGLINCSTTGRKTTPALNDIDLMKSMKGIMMAGSGLTCTGWSGWSNCDAPCGKAGTSQNKQTCTDERGESITKYKMRPCKIRCPKPIVVVDETMCSLEDWNRGRVWIPHPANCHLYFVCERVYNDKFRMHGIDCGELFWNQKTLLCEEKSPKPNVVKCKDVRNRVQRPPVIATPADCGDDDLLLQFDFESGFKDSCINSPLIQKGTTDVTQELQKGNNVACFDGTSSMEIPFLKSWFRKMKKVTAFSVAIWYNRCSAETRTEQGLVHNGGCLATNSGFQVTTGYGGAFAGVTTRDSFPPGLKQLFAVTAPGSNWKDPAGWQQAVLVFDGIDEKLYLQGYERERAPSEGFMLNGNTRTFLGRLCGDKFFCGCVDNLRIWKKALTAGEVLSLQKN